MRPLPIVLALLLSLLVACVGCDHNSAALLEAGPNEPQVRSLSATQSRVFDGRDSVATGTDGLVATQTNFAIVTEFVAVKVEGGDDVRDAFKGIDDPDNLDPTTPLFESRENEPILAPDDMQVTWGEFSRADGAIIVKCTEQGTHSVAHLSGLIPKSVYSAWIDVFDPDTGDRIGRFAYAKIDAKGKSKGNVFRASAQGEGHIAGLVPPRVLGDGDKKVEISACMLEDVERGTYDWRAVGIYHIDGTPGVDEVADAGTFVEQVGFAFETEPVVE